MASYSADLVLDTAGDLVVVCGTVFNQVLVWYVSCKDGCINDGDEIEPQLTLNGHNVCYTILCLHCT